MVRVPSVVLPLVRGAPRREVSVKLLFCICTWPSPRCWDLSISEQSSSVWPSQSLSTPSQTLLSLVMVSPTHVPSWQLSLLVQVSPSEQSPPLAAGGNEQPVSTSQVFSVHGLSSSHAAGSGANVQPTASQVSIVKSMPSSRRTGAPVHAPPSRRRLRCRRYSFVHQAVRRN